MHKYFLILIFITQISLAQEIKNVITDPAISRRCQFLINERNDKIKLQQRLSSLAQRTDKLLMRVKENEESLKTKLKFSKTQIQNNLSLNKLQVRKMEENIVRKGCPGIFL